jgi:hypothetical protein
MRIKLNQRWTNWLLKLPESGMGFQSVDIRFADGRELTDVIVLNAEEVELPDDFARAEINSITLHSG